jgi:hypothetical protein
LVYVQKKGILISLFAVRTFIQIVVILCTLLAFGAAKLHFEDQLNRDMVAQRLIQPPLKQGTSLQLGQTGAAVALGGLRSLIAAVWNLRAFLHFENLDWIKLEKSYQVITTLQPQTTHYWITGAWHLHTNASVHHKEDPELSPFRRAALQKLYITKGSDFLEEGVKHNPDNWKLHDALAKVWSDQFKLPDLERALRHYDNLLACDTVPAYRRTLYERFRYYTLCRLPSRHADALKEGVRLYKASSRNHTPSLVNYLFALQNEFNVSEEDRIPETELYSSKKQQLSWLQNLWDRRDQDFPMSGVRAKIKELQLENETP